MSEVFVNQSTVAQRWRAQISELRYKLDAAKKSGNKSLVSRLSVDLKKWESAYNQLITKGSSNE